ncbi:MAG: hypothetical protein ACYSRZ_07970 [Planctomycetota bacterium]|jgi:hypothetical protein
MNAEKLEKCSSAITLSDMEIFVFPELMYSLVLANIMSPVIWQWRQLDCFRKLDGKSSYKKLMRLKQFIMDEYDFNLDLETWGLTSKTKELKRFEKYITANDIAKSNALFGYHGDQYYFDVDIRRHFGLDKYNDDVIPYWKTETVEAMGAFALKPGYRTAAGECVSLAALYAAAAFIICQIPLEDIYMILTPLHSQNFIDINGGVLTNNRRLITRTMWFNGTAISNKAQRALRNENVTILAHPSGYIHCLYDEATINKENYQRFTKMLRKYLSTELSILVFANFLRCKASYQRYFQLCRDCHGQARFLKAEVLFHYEHGSNFRIADATHEKLLAEVSDEDFLNYALPGRIRCDKLEEFITEQKIDLKEPSGRELLKNYLQSAIPAAERFVSELADFVHVEPELPNSEKKYIPGEPIKIPVDFDRTEIIDYLQDMRKTNTTAELAFYAYRDILSCQWQPFIKAAIERNPVSIKKTDSMTIKQVYKYLENMADKSIYDGKRLAQPDEVANYNTGDGLEKALLLANVICSRGPEQQIKITVDNSKVILQTREKYEFASDKGLRKQITISSGCEIFVD